MKGKLNVTFMVTTINWNWLKKLNFRKALLLYDIIIKLTCSEN